MVVYHFMNNNMDPIIYNWVMTGLITDIKSLVNKLRTIEYVYNSNYNGDVNEISKYIISCSFYNELLLKFRVEFVRQNRLLFNSKFMIYSYGTIGSLHSAIIDGNYFYSKSVRILKKYMDIKISELDAIINLYHAIFGGHDDTIPVSCEGYDAFDKSMATGEQCEGR